MLTIQREHDKVMPRSYEHLPTVGAFISGDSDLIAKAVRRSRELLPKSKAEQEPPSPTLLPHAIAMAIAAAYEDYDPTAVFEVVAGAKYTDASADLQRIVLQILGRGRKATLAKAPAKVATDEEWIDLVFEGPADQSLDLALTPDHSRWTALAMFTLPLAYLLARDAKSWRERFAELMRFGPFAKVENEIVYENDVVSKDLEVRKGKTRWHVGFDVLRLHEDQLFVYHYVGAVASAAEAMKVMPGVFSRADDEWARLERAIEPKLWKRVAKAIEACTHTIVYREGRKPISKKWLQDTAAQYDVRLEAADVVEAGGEPAK